MIFNFKGSYAASGTVDFAIIYRYLVSRGQHLWVFRGKGINIVWRLQIDPTTKVGLWE